VRRQRARGDRIRDCQKPECRQRKRDNDHNPDDSKLARHFEFSGRAILAVFAPNERAERPFWTARPRFESAIKLSFS
jgi:hypothetical protein